MSKRRTIEDTMADAYDASVARQQREEDDENERAARLGGDTIEETMSNVYDDIQDREKASRESQAEPSYEYGAPPPEPEPEPKKWYDYQNRTTRLMNRKMSMSRRHLPPLSRHIPKRLPLWLSRRRLRRQGRHPILNRKTTYMAPMPIPTHFFPS